MNYDEFRRQLGKAGLTNKEFAELLALNEKSVSNLATKEAIPNHIAIISTLMGCLADNGISFREKIEKLHIKKAEARGNGFKKKADIIT